MKREGRPHKVRFLHKGLTFGESRSLEKFFIAAVGRLDLKTGPLVNLTDGGEGIHGRIVTAEESRRRSENWDKHYGHFRKDADQFLRDAQEQGLLHGVQKNHGGWKAYLAIKKGVKYLADIYPTAREAAVAYDEAVERYRRRKGARALPLNFPPLDWPSILGSLTGAAGVDWKALCRRRFTDSSRVSV